MTECHAKLVLPENRTFLRGMNPGVPSLVTAIPKSTLLVDHYTRCFRGAIYFLWLLIPSEMAPLEDRSNIRLNSVAQEGHLRVHGPLCEMKFRLRGTTGAGTGKSD
ncbi:MAG: hypothetical protein ACLU4J_07720 [Butyricimonas paravirosa]